MKIIRDKQSGFTIIELLVATSVFSIVLVVALAGILRVTQLYYKGVTASRTQEVARTLSDELSESIQYSNYPIIIQADPLVAGPEVSVTATDDTNFFCIGPKRYTYAIDRQLKSSPNTNFKQKTHVMWVDVPESGCSDPANLTAAEPSPPSDGGRELLGENMRISRLEIIPEVSLGREVYTINLSVAYGDHDENDFGGPLTTSGSSRTCQSSSSPFVGQFCHVSAISVTVERRLQ